jgi:small subunit ribosomal protein S28
MLLRLSSRFFAPSPLLQSLSYIPSRSANTFIDEEYIRENPPPNDQSIPSTNLKKSSSSSNNPNEPMTFAKMFRQSKFVQLGGLKGRLLSGRIVDVVDDDLYVDFGGKFHAVVQRPQTKQRDQYAMGAVVSIRLQSWEMAARFVGAARHISLLEADAQLVGLLKRVDRTVKPRDKDIDLRYRSGDSKAPISSKREVL